MLSQRVIWYRTMIFRVMLSFAVAVVIFVVVFYISSCAYLQSQPIRIFDHPGVEEELFLPPLEPFVKPAIAKLNAIPLSHFSPPTLPAGGLDALLDGIANEGIIDEDVAVARVLEYIVTYYPLVGLEDDIVSQLDDRQRAEYKRQNDALDKEVFGSDYTLIKRVESLLRVPIAILNILRKE